jgi:hypothetical protein
MSDPEEAAFAAHPELRRLAELRDRGGWLFVHHQDFATMGFRTWPDGSGDALIVQSLTDARALRRNPAGSLVWQREGGIADVLDGLLELPTPSDPLAPRLVIGSPPSLWTP